MARGLQLWFGFVFALVTFSASAHESKVDSCERYLKNTQPITLRSLRELSQKRIAAVEKSVPRPGFDNIEVEAAHEQIADTQVPQALREVFGNGVGYVSTPAPTSPDPVTVNLTVENYSIPLHVDSTRNGRRVSTTAYVALPKNKMNTAGGYVIGNDYPVAVVHIHGGGTPTATGKNAMSIGEKLASSGIPTIALDMPGHGRATRKIDGFESMEAQVDWLLEQIDTLVHPGVKIVLSGHSWGGIFATYMHRHSAEPKYARIARFISLSPGVDTSLSGDNKKKQEWDIWWEENFRDYELKIAPADYDFQENMLANGKDSDVGGYHTTFTDFDYATPPLTPEEQAKLKPITVVVGDADGVVYVGREKQFQAAYGSLVKPNEFIILGPGRTWKSKGPDDLIPTGHNIFDRYVDGTETLQVYAMMIDIARAEAGGQVDGGAPADPASTLLDSVMRHYANFFAFREMVQSDVEFVDSNSPQLAELSKRKVALDEYARRLDEALAEGTKFVQAEIVKAIDRLRTEIGMTENLNLKRAQEELAIPELTPAREAELRDYIARVNAVDAEMKSNFQDPQYDRDEKALMKEFAGLVKQLGLNSLDEYRPHFDKANSSGRKDLDPAATKLRGDLSRLHQKFSDLARARQARYGSERDRRVSMLENPHGVMDVRSALRELNSDRTPDRLSKLREFVLRYPEVEEAARVVAEHQHSEKVDAIPRPEGVGHWGELAQVKARQDSIMSMTYETDSPVVARLARRISELTEERDRIVRGNESELSLDRLSDELEKVRTKRNGMIKKWDGIWKSGLVTSPVVAARQADYDNALDAYKQMHVAYQAKGRWLRELKEAGALNEETVLASTPEIRTIRQKLQKARAYFIQTRETLNEVRWIEAISGQLVPKVEAQTELGVKTAADATKLAIELWGEDYVKSGKPAIGSLTAQVKTKEEYVETRRREASLLDRQRNELRYQYVREMQARGMATPYVIDRVPIWPLLNMPLRDLLPLLRTNPTMYRALELAKQRWETLLIEVRRNASARGDSSY